MTQPAERGSITSVFFVQVACGSTFKQFYEVALDTEHHAFCFRVAHADVVFDHHRFTFHLDKAEEDEAFVSDVFFFQAVDGRFDDACAYFLHKYFIGKWNGVTLPIPPVFSPLSPSPMRL